MYYEVSREILLNLVGEATEHERPPRVIARRESEFAFDTQLLAALFGKRELVIYDIPPNPTFAQGGVVHGPDAETL